MPATDFPQASLALAGGLTAAIEPETLVYVALNVGDGDCQLVVLPADAAGRRRLIVVDTIRAAKLIKLVGDLDAADVLGPDGGQVEIVVATHPHADHIRGIPKILDTYAGSRPEVWDSGYRHASGMFMDILDRVAQHGLRRTVVSAGMSRTIGQTGITVLAPSVGLQRQFDTYGVNVNDASVTLKIDYPATNVLRDVQQGRKTLQYINRDIGHSLILGADAQMRSWSQVLVDFPQLGPIATPVTDALRLTGGTNPLAADVFKVPHHGSKHGLTLELVEAIAPAVSIVSSGHSGGSYEFPHEVAMSQLREAVNARSSQPGVPYDADDTLKLLYTGSDLDDGGGAAGSVCVLCPLAGDRQVWRLMDAADADIDLDGARRLLK
jgi:beta-lactamase superfamily II metal-dependent hydrolase